MPETVECPIERNVPQEGPPWRRWGSGLMYFLVFCILATICLLWALGYRINWAAETIERTGIVELSTAQAGLRPEVYINGVHQPDSLPLTLRWLFPGHYDVLVTLEGYQEWRKTVSVSENQRVSYPGILMLYTDPQVIPVPDIRTDELVNRRYDNNRIEIRSGNELWVDDKFITRTSADIFNPEYYFDNEHVIYQVGTELVVRDLVAATSETLVTFTTNAPVPFVTRENGRIIIYLENEELKAFALFQTTSIIDRLGVSR